MRHLVQKLALQAGTWANIGAAGADEAEEADVKGLETVGWASSGSYIGLLAHIGARGADVRPSSSPEGPLRNETPEEPRSKPQAVARRPR